MGKLVQSKPFDACQPLQVNATGSIVLAIRGGFPACSFTTKIKNIELANASAAIIMNADHKNIISDDLIEMGNMQEDSDISIPSVYITNQSGQRLVSRLHSNESVIVCLNATGETTIATPTFLDMVISFLQLSVVVWTAIALMYAVTYCSSLIKVFKRRRAVQSLQTVLYHVNEKEVNECSICLEAFQEKDRVKILPCQHIFHEHCAQGWIGDIRGVCPLCRQGIFKNKRDNLIEQSLNRELNELVDREALRTHSRTLIYLFIILYIIFIVGSIFFPYRVFSNKQCHLK